MTFRERLAAGLVLLDGAMGTEIQRFKPTDEEWAGHQGCSEILLLTAPAKIQAIHEAYFAAGSDIVETNTFGANSIVLAEFGMADKVEELNIAGARLARAAAAKYSADKPRYVAGSMGPGTKLASLGQTTYDELHASYEAQARGLLAGGVDLFMIETCQDLLQVKAAINAVRDAQISAGQDIPILVSVTIESNGTMLIGSDIGAAIVALEAMDIDILGINCATGPEAMGPYLQQLAQQFSGHLMVMPNAGLPQNVGGQMVYTLAAEDFARQVAGFVTEHGVAVVGGCCGTSPEYIRALAEKTRGLVPAARRPVLAPSAASLYGAQTLRQDPAPFFIGERANTNGSKQFRELLLAGDWDGIVDVAVEQQRGGAHAVDLCVAYTGRDERADMVQAVARIAKQVTLPLVIDSTSLDVMEAALKLYGGRAIINSINLEDGEARADQICRLAKRYGAVLIALTIDEEGMAKTVERKLAIARRIHDIAVQRHGLRAQDLVFDVLTFTLGSGDVETKDAGILTLEAIRRVKAELPGVFTVLGVSNISFGLSPASRRVLNSVFLHEAVQAGLDAAIFNVRSLLPLHTIDPADRAASLDLIHDRGESPLFGFIKHFEAKSGVQAEAAAPDESLTLDERISKRIVDGSSAGLEALLVEKVKESPALAIINGLLIPAMKVVGDLFGSGELQLPFVLQSAEVMKRAVDTLQPYIEKTGAETATSIVLATVRGDVHDIGKNLVDIILTNNGFTVHNLGIKCELETIASKAREVNADAIGMSGLLVKSTVVMKENIEELAHRSLRIPVLLGGAALTRSYVDEVCAPLAEAPVVYCQDAFEGLRVMNLIKEGRLDEAATADRVRHAPRVQPPAAPPQPVVVEELRPAEIPAAPFWGTKVVEAIDLDEVYGYLTEEVLFRGRWGYRRGKLDKEGYERLIRDEVRPALARLQAQARDERLFEPKVVYGYFPCNAEGDEVVVYDRPGGAELARFSFPRQKQVPNRCIADFFAPADSGKTDLIALQAVTVGPRATEHAQGLYAGGSYKEYLLFHGLAVETAEALAELWHRRIRVELGIQQADGAGISELVAQHYRGSRYSFGYPACPDLAENATLCTLLGAERIGIGMTENGQMTPEQTTSAFIAHHPQAKYFAVE